MKEIGIFYFSGTGNTEIVAYLLNKSYQQKQIKVELFRIDDLVNHNKQVDVNKFDMIGIGHPVLGFGASSMMDRFVEMLPARGGKKTFVFKTASSHHYINHGASDAVIQGMEQKGYTVFHNSIVAMPCNWFMKYDDRMNKQLYKAAVMKVEKIANETANEQQQRLRINPILSKILRFINYLEEQKGAKFFSQGLITSEKCTMCKKCVRDCPRNNISEVQGKICFGSNCLWCMRCIYSCPSNAIEAANLPSCVLKPYTGGFNIHKILNDPTIEGNYVTKKSKGYYKHFIKYFEDL